MPHGHHIATCRDCGTQWVVGDCIPSICDECEDMRRKAKAEGTPGRCKDCGALLLTNGRCLDCEIFGAKHA